MFNLLVELVRLLLILSANSACHAAVSIEYTTPTTCLDCTAKLDLENDAFWILFFFATNYAGNERKLIKNCLRNQS